jgi:hypothetical protein
LDGTSVSVEFHQDLAQDVLIEKFPSASISVFLHMNDSEGEGGSDLWFLAENRSDTRTGRQCNRFLEALAPRLCDGAIVVTDGLLADPQFSEKDDFTAVGKRWAFLGGFRHENRSDRKLRFWRAFDS